MYYDVCCSWLTWVTTTSNMSSLKFTVLTFSAYTVTLWVHIVFMRLILSYIVTITAKYRQYGYSKGIYEFDVFLIPTDIRNLSLFFQYINMYYSTLHCIRQRSLSYTSSHISSWANISTTKYRPRPPAVYSNLYISSV
jgi:hypothetical protein